jgi:hypothetical protein
VHSSQVCTVDFMHLYRSIYHVRELTIKNSVHTIIGPTVSVNTSSHKVEETLHTTSSSSHSTDDRCSEWFKLSKLEGLVNFGSPLSLLKHNKVVCKVAVVWEDSSVSVMCCSKRLNKGVHNTGACN